MPAGRHSAHPIPPWIKVPAALCDPVTVTSGPFVERFVWQSVIQVHDTPSALCPSLFQWQMNPVQKIRTLVSTSGERTRGQGGDWGTGAMATADGNRVSPAIDKCPSNRIHSLSRMRFPHWLHSITKARCSGAIIPAIVG